MSNHAARQSDETCCWAFRDDIHEEEGEGEPARRDRDDAVHVDGRVAGEPAREVNEADVHGREVEASAKRKVEKL